MKLPWMRHQTNQINFLVTSLLLALDGALTGTTVI